MKKIIILFIGILVFSIFSTVNSNSGELLENKSTSTEEKTYIYYYGEGCSHCYNVDKYLTSVDGYNKAKIEKREVYFDDKNRQDMLSDGKRLGLSEAEIGVPFMVVSDNLDTQALVGDKSIIDHFIPILGENPGNDNKTIVLTILGVLTLLVPVFLIKLTKNN